MKSDLFLADKDGLSETVLQHGDIIIFDKKEKNIMLQRPVTIKGAFAGTRRMQIGNDNKYYFGIDAQGFAGLVHIISALTGFSFEQCTVHADNKIAFKFVTKK